MTSPTSNKNYPIQTMFGSFMISNPCGFFEKKLHLEQQQACLGTPVGNPKAGLVLDTIDYEITF